jgi:acyl-CoA synthetase (AMP-forming)/AMP-acid ligase II
MATGLFRQVAVIGVPDPYAGQVVHAVAVASGQLDVPAVLAGLAEKLPAYMMPRDIELVPALPVTGNGKVDYRTLARERGEHAAR